MDGKCVTECADAQRESLKAWKMMAKTNLHRHRRSRPARMLQGPKSSVNPAARCVQKLPVRAPSYSNQNV